MGSQESDTTERLSLSHGKNPTISMKQRQEIIAQDHAHLPHVSSFLWERILVHGTFFFFSFLFCFVLFWLCHVACGVLVPQPGIKPTAPALEVQGLNHWTAGEVLVAS